METWVKYLSGGDKALEKKCTIQESMRPERYYVHCNGMENAFIVSKIEGKVSLIAVFSQVTLGGVFVPGESKHCMLEPFNSIIS